MTRRELGGVGWNQARAVTANPDGGYVVAGSTTSNDGDVTGNHGYSDYWVVKLNFPPTVTGLSASPSPICGGQSVQFTATVGNAPGIYYYALTNGAGNSKCFP